MIWDLTGTFWKVHGNLCSRPLLAYWEEHHNCRVPLRWNENPQLATWVHWVRASRKRGKVSPERIQQLDELGFDWDLLESAWESKFKALEAYKQVHHDCNVPQEWSENPQLAKWVSKQRGKKDRLSSEQLRRLNGLGFDWEPVTSYWEAMYKALVTY